MTTRTVKCKNKRRGRRCQQPAEHDGLCLYHLTKRFLESTGEPFREDPYYRDKVQAGLLSTSIEFEPSETTALYDGKVHGDGRRLDQWVPPKT